MPRQQVEERDPEKEFLQKYVIDKKVFMFYKLVFRSVRL